MIVSRSMTNICYVLDSEGLSLAALKNQEMTLRLSKARRSRIRVVTSSITLVEAYHDRIPRPAWQWAMSRIIVEPVTQDIADEAIALLREAGLHGHKYAIDAALAAIARRQRGSVVIYTSDADDMKKLCGDRAFIKQL